MQGNSGRAFQLGSDGSKLASTNGTFRVLDGNEKGVLVPYSPQRRSSNAAAHRTRTEQTIAAAPKPVLIWMPWSRWSVWRYRIAASKVQQQPACQIE